VLLGYTLPFGLFANTAMQYFDLKDRDQNKSAVNFALSREYLQFAIKPSVNAGKSYWVKSVLFIV
jgi:hypothetical protein